MSRRAPPGKVLSILIMLWSLIPLTFLVAGIRDYFGSHASMGWPEAPALRISATVVQGKGKQRGMFYLESAYTYQVNGMVFLGSRVSFGDHRGRNEAELNSLAAKLVPGFPVRFDPDNPRESVLFPGAPSNDFGPPLAIASLMFLLLFGLGFRSYRAASIRSATPRAT